MALEQGRGVNRHGTVEKNRQGMRYLALCLQLRNGVQQGLCTANGKHGNHRHPATGGHTLQGRGKLTQDVLYGMDSIAIGGFDQHRVRRGRRIGWVHHQIVGTPQVS